MDNAEYGDLETKLNYYKRTQTNFLALNVVNASQLAFRANARRIAFGIVGGSGDRLSIAFGATAVDLTGIVVYANLIPIMFTLEQLGEAITREINIINSAATNRFPTLWEVIKLP